MKFRNGFTLIETIISLSIISFIYINLLQSSLTTKKASKAISKRQLSQLAAINIATFAASLETKHITYNGIIKPKSSNCSQVACNQQQLLNWASYIFTNNIKRQVQNICIQKTPVTTKVTLTWHNQDSINSIDANINNCTPKSQTTGVMVETATK